MGVIFMRKLKFCRVRGRFGYSGRAVVIQTAILIHLLSYIASFLGA